MSRRLLLSPLIAVLGCAATPDAVYRSPPTTSPASSKPTPAEIRAVGIWIRSIDGQRVTDASYAGPSLQLLPGRHALVVEFVTPHRYGGDVITTGTLTHTFQPAHQYELSVHHTYQRRDVNVTLVDRTAGTTELNDTPNLNRFFQAQQR